MDEHDLRVELAGMTAGVGAISACVKPGSKYFHLRKFVLDSSGFLPPETPVQDSVPVRLERDHRDESVRMRLRRGGDRPEEQFPAGAWQPFGDRQGTQEEIMHGQAWRRESIPAPRGEGCQARNVDEEVWGGVPSAIEGSSGIDHPDESGEVWIGECLRVGRDQGEDTENEHGEVWGGDTDGECGY